MSAPGAQGRLLRAALQVIRGAFMGAADVVPGVSGGTVALLLGIYDRLIGAVHTGARALGCLVRGDVRGAARRSSEVPWGFVLPLLAGLLAAVAVLAGVIEQALVDHPESMAGLFTGLVLASILIARRDVAWTRPRVATVVIVGTALFAVLGLKGAPVVDPSPVVLFASGAVAICAMVLPGISGSFLLLMVGMYGTMIQVVDDRMVADAAVFGAGAIVGLACFSTLLARLLARRHDDVLAVMVGLLVGSLRVLWPWPHGVGVISRHAEEAVAGTALGWPEAAGGLVGPTLLATLSLVVVLAVDRLARGRLQAGD